jgi:RCC1 and BTB domain-containing protein
MSEFIKKDRVLSKLNKAFTRNIKFIFVFGFNGCDVLIITKDDKFYSFGSNVNGCLGLGHKGSIEKPTIVHDLCDRKIVDICDGFQHVIARTENGEVFSWGHNNYGQLGIGTRDAKSPALRWSLQL